MSDLEENIELLKLQIMETKKTLEASKGYPFTNHAYEKKLNDLEKQLKYEKRFKGVEERIKTIFILIILTFSFSLIRLDPSGFATLVCALVLLFVFACISVWIDKRKQEK